jgi:hypothetical protein
VAFNVHIEQWILAQQFYKRAQACLLVNHL